MEEAGEDAAVSVPAVTRSAGGRWRSAGGVAHLRAAADLVWAACCGGCGRAGPAWCDRCRAEVSGPPSCSQVAGDVLLVAAAGYGGAARALLLAVKEGGRAELRPVAASLLARAVATAHRESVAGGDAPVSPCAREAGAPPLVLVPVPSRRAARRRRGGDLVADLAARAAVLVRAGGGVVRVHRGLRLRRRVLDQAGLDRSARLVNLAGALRWVGPPPVGPCVVVDDVVTTGATATEAVRALRAVGADVRAVAALTVARR